MATPVATRLGTGTSKVSGTSVPPVISSTDFEATELLVVCVAMDPAVGAVDCHASGGTAAFATAVAEQDYANGSGTSGVRAVVQWQACTAAGTLTDVAVSVPTCTAKASVAYKVTGVDSLDPVALSAALDAVAGLDFATWSTGLPYQHDVLGLDFYGTEGPAGAALNAVAAFNDDLNADWTSDAKDATSIGTTGGGAASNVSFGIGVSHPGVQPLTEVTTTIAARALLAEQNACIGLIFQSPGPSHLTMPPMIG